MKITEIIVHEGRGYNHPYEQFSNFKQGITLKATIDPNWSGELENPEACIKRLQEKAATQMDDIKKRTLDSLEKINSLEAAKRQIEIELDRQKSRDDRPF